MTDTRGTSIYLHTTFHSAENLKVMYSKLIQKAKRRRRRANKAFPFKNTLVPPWGKNEIEPVYRISGVIWVTPTHPHLGSTCNVLQISPCPPPACNTASHGHTYVSVACLYSPFVVISPLPTAEAGS